LKGKLNLLVSSSRRKLIVPPKPLRGRILPYELHPLSFKEFLRFKEVKVETTTAGIGRVEKALKEYLIYGGFPEVVLMKNRTEKIRLLNSYFRDIIGLDIAEISHEDIVTVETFARYVLETTYFSASKCLNFFKTLGYRIGKQTILNLEKYSQEGYIFFFVPIFSRTIKNRAQYPRKAYVGDTGFKYAMTGKINLGQLFENVVFLSLKRRLLPQYEVFYWKNPKGMEVDFLVCEGLNVKEIIQVAYELKRIETEEREVQNLLACAEEFGLRKGLIITESTKGFKTIKGVRICFIPLREWLLR
jgi:hypothetical protein